MFALMTTRRKTSMFLTLVWFFFCVTAVKAGKDRFPLDDDHHMHATSKHDRTGNEQNSSLVDYMHTISKQDKEEIEQHVSLDDGYTHATSKDHQQNRTQNRLRSFPLDGYTNASFVDHQQNKSENGFSNRSTRQMLTVLESGQDKSNADLNTTPSPPLALLQSSDCRPIEETRTERSGVIAVTETQEDCNHVWTWKIQAPSTTEGIVLQFHDVYMRRKCTLEVFTIPAASDRVRQRMFTSAESDYANFSPLLLQENLALVELNTPYESYKYTFSRVNITYEAYAKATMPYTVVDATVPSTSIRMYNCSGNNLVPSAMRCNMVKQCVLNEDEEGCDYTKLGCGDWIPYRDQCLKMEFVMSFSYRPGKPHPTFPSVAEETCKSKYGGTLALLIDSVGINLVGNALKQSGHSSVVVGIEKVKPVNKKLRHLYRFMWQWGPKGSSIAYEQQRIQRVGALLDCATLDTYPSLHLHPLRCVQPDRMPDGYVCMRLNPSHPGFAVQPTLGVSFPRPSRQLDQIPTKQCSDGSLVQVFHECPSWVDGAGFSGWSPNNFPLFRCRYGPPVHYALVCDGYSDCADGSDEMFCGVVKFHPLLSSTFACENRQLVAETQRCDGVVDCFDESDEVDCTACTGNPRGQLMCTGVGCVPSKYANYIEGCPTIALYREGELVSYNPSVVLLDGYGMSRFIRPEGSSMEGMFRCSDGDYIPSFLLNNHELDCKFGDDESIPVENFTCPGFYRCQYSDQCVHPDFVCDGVYHCPNKDDERYCNTQCPDDCVCEGYAFSCSRFFNTSAFLHARYLDLSGAVDLSLHGIHFLESLLFLNLSHCRLGNVSLLEMQQLQILDLSFNEVKNLSSLAFERLTGLWFLNISGNPLVQTLDSSFRTFVQQSGLTGLKYLILTDTDIRSIEGGSLGAMTELRSLDLRNSRIDSYDKDIFGGLAKLEHLFTDDSKLCCSYFHESLRECLAPFDELSSCSDLLRVDIFRLFLWLFSLLAIIGNASVILYRSFATKAATSPSVFGMLVSNLCGADFLMGIYMMIIGIADAQFRGVYVAKENVWKRSSACTIAGFLGFVSSEVSALIICVITLDRLLVLCFPLKSHLHFERRSSVAVCCVVWFLGVTLAALPLLLNLEFYGVNSICLPLPITRQRFSGQSYSFGIFIVVNFVLFLFIGVGQALIYRAIRKAGTQAGTHRRLQEMAIARRLFLVVFTDFCCWFPIGLMGLLAAGGTPIPGEVNVWAAIFVLPLNSALNPFLYTLNAALEKWRGERLKKRAKKMLGNMQAELHKLQPSVAEEVVKICIRSRVVKREQMLQWLQLRQDSRVTNFSDSEYSTERTSSIMLREVTSEQSTEESR